MTKKKIAIAYARSIAAWWRGEQSPYVPLTSGAIKVAKDAHSAVIGGGWGDRRPTASEIADSWDRAADLLKKGGTP